MYITFLILVKQIFTVQQDLGAIVLKDLFNLGFNKAVSAIATLEIQLFLEISVKVCDNWPSSSRAEPE